MIDPEGAEVTTQHKRSWSDDARGWGGHAVHTRLPSLGHAADMVVDIGGKVLDGLGAGLGPYRFTEAIIMDGDPLYAIGQFRTVSGGGQGGTLHELTGAVLREWKRRPETLRERFDSNRDGMIDAGEWERAREAARHEAGRAHAENLKRGQLHTLGKPDDGRFFLLSNLQQFGLLKRYLWWMRIGFGGFLLCGGAALLMLST